MEIDLIADDAAAASTIPDEGIRNRAPTEADPHAGPCDIRDASESHDGDEHPFLPGEPTTLEEAGLSCTDIEALILKHLLNSNSDTGKGIADQLRLAGPLVRDAMKRMRSELLVSLKGEATLGDFVYQLTDTGVERARRYSEQCTYFGAAPVSLEAYAESVKRQSLSGLRPRIVDLCEAFRDLLLNPEVISQLGQALHAGHGLFLYGAPGNGKTSIAERILKAVDQTLWIPRTLSSTGGMIRLFDPSIHEELSWEELGSVPDGFRVDRRWVLIRRPTIVVGGELTLEQLDVRFNPATGINEAPIQLKSNGGALIIDDFGRQRMSSEDLLNRWIVPLEKRYDHVNLPSGRQIQIPFEQLLVLSTNLEPTDLMDEAFLRRIPYKVEVTDPSVEQFRQLIQLLASQMGIGYCEEAVDHLIDKHYRAADRPLRFSHPRDLLLQIRNLCEFHEWPLEMTSEAFDVAVKNYFAVQ